MHSNRRSYRGGALLFAIVTGISLSIVVGTLILIILHQQFVTEKVRKRILANYLLQAGAEYAIYTAYTTGDTGPLSLTFTTPDGQWTVNSKFKDDSNGLSEYTVEVTTTIE